MSSSYWDEQKPFSVNDQDYNHLDDQGQPVIKKVVFQPLPDSGPVSLRRGIAPEFHGVNLNISAELGKVALKVRELINLEEGSVLKLNRIADEKVVILVNDIPFAHGEIVVINDRFGIRITALVGEEDNEDEAGSGKEG